MVSEFGGSEKLTRETYIILPLTPLNLQSLATQKSSKALAAFS